MFTLQQIQTAHSKVKSGADFPTYIQYLKQIKVLCYETFVEDGHTDFYGDNNYKISSPAKYQFLQISNELKKEDFSTDLKAHQQGKTGYIKFCNDCAKSGIEKWRVSIKEMTCTYFDKQENEALIELIPQ